MIKSLKEYYGKSPFWLQNLGLNVYGYYWNRLRYGGSFNNYLKEFEERNRYSAESWNKYQTDELRKLLNHSAKYVPYFKDLFKKLGITNFSDFSIADLEKLPLLEKEQLRSNPQNHISIFPKSAKTYSYPTSGTTGTPLTILFTKDFHRIWSAVYEVRVRNWAGINHKMSRAMIGGQLIIPRTESSPPFWRYNFIEKQLYLSAFHISPKNVPYYVEALNKYQPEYLVGYASSHFYLAKEIVRQGLSVFKPKALLTSSESLTSEMRQMITQAYGCQVFDAYSGVEFCCLASECKYHKMHVSPDIGIIELLDINGNLVENGEPGEIVATGLLNSYQPLIRYRTGDIAVMSDESCECGSSMPVIREIVGRLEDTIIGSDGQKLVRFHGIFVGLNNVKEGQIVQKAINKFLVRLVVEPEFGDSEKDKIHNRFEQRLGKIDLEFEFLEKIERTKRGKFRAVISDLSPRDDDF